MTPRDWEAYCNDYIRHMVRAGEQSAEIGPPRPIRLPCWQCGGTKIVRNRLCNMCDDFGKLTYEGRS